MLYVNLILSKSTSKDKIKKLEPLKTLLQEELNSIYVRKIDFDLDVFVYLIPNFSNDKITYAHEDTTKKIAYFNDPNILNNSNDTKYRVFRALLDSYLQNFDLESFIDNENKFFTILVSFGKELKIKDNKEDGKILADTEEHSIVYVPIEPYYSLDQVILNSEVLDEIRKTLMLLQQRHILYEVWGFKSVEPSPKAILNFYGPPGTGKTMTAHAIAKYLNTKILALNYADIESKFVGEAPKNLVRAFKTAEKENALLFFDEADSFLGRRITSVTSSADQAVNSLRSQMLILLENFTGIVIFATNLLKNYDRAFESRIFKHIKFDLPDKPLRIKMIAKMIPPEVPLEKPIDENQLDELAEISEGFSGRDIKNCIRDALSSVLFQNKHIVLFDDLKVSFISYKEKKKDIEKEYQGGGFDPITKRQLEEKIKKNLKEEENMTEEREKNKAILSIGLHALWADNNAKTEELEILKRAAQILNVEIDITTSPDRLLPLEELVSKLITKKDKLSALDLVIRILTSDGEICNQEEEFLSKILCLLGIEGKLLDEFEFVKKSLLDAHGEWRRFCSHYLTD